MGGSCVELESGGARLLLDLGLPLVAHPDEPAALPNVPGLADDSDSSLLGVVVSHAHLDHYGLLPLARPDLPVYIGEASARILAEAAFFSPAGLVLRPYGFLRDREPLEVGPFRITPYLVDHSAYDSYALLVEAEERRLFYSGDLRAHGRKPGSFRRLLEDPPLNVDALLLEGTRVTATGDDGRSALSEPDLELEFAERFRATEGLAIVLAAGQNLDRLVTAYKAARRAGRTLVVDLYTATLARATGRTTMPQPGTHDVRVYIPNRQRVLVKRSGEFERTGAVAGHRVSPEELRERSGTFALLGQGSTLAELGRAGCLAHASAAWSMWAGYLDADSGRRARELLERYGVPLITLHASGHATLPDLQRLADVLGARTVVPIHTAAPKRFRELFANAELREDGEWWPA